MNSIIEIVSLIILGIILFFTLRKQKREEDKYFGKDVPLSKMEIKTLEKYKTEYIEIEQDTRLPTFDKDDFELVDISKSATEMIYDNPIPTEIEKNRVETNDYVKLKFLDQDQEVERMWVKVLEKNGRIFKGLLKNDSYSTDDLKVDKEIWFHSNHIFEIENK
ncbi:DUF2314 domain-containing protein [Flammeovirga sp. SJP92]|uniref:DUF2314 domain-containing protein n=1 Tax=Flammeovirga sp. SJP92 TaxID=1775430 RepID=UPI000787BF52|nr:DUF2314 domain-containing protein [Flammeovirga sp. SJP92]KXX66931.1 hypothetical protein AVL50_29705 [Flammeovirga sp. SJP92]